MNDDREETRAEHDKKKFEAESAEINDKITALDKTIDGILKEMAPLRDKLVRQHHEAIKILHEIASSPKMTRRHYKRINAIINNFEYIRHFYISGITFQEEKYYNETIKYLWDMLKRYHLTINSKDEIVKKPLPGEC